MIKKNISTDVLDHVILFHDKSQLLITEKQAMAVDQALNFGQASHLRINNQTYSKGSMSKIIKLDEYYKQYPDQKSREYEDVSELLVKQGLSDAPPPVTQNNIINRASSKGLREMMKGFLKYGKKEHPLYKAMEVRARRYDGI